LNEEGIWGFRIGSVGESIQEPDLNLGQGNDNEIRMSKYHATNDYDTFLLENC
jgi:hypothetical protein